MNNQAGKLSLSRVTRETAVDVGLATSLHPGIGFKTIFDIEVLKQDQLAFKICGLDVS